MARPSFREAFRYWLLLGCISVGGPAGQIALMHRDLVGRLRWIGERRFLHALNFCTLLPGPEATQLAIYVGWLLHRTIGGLVAGVLFILPGAILIGGLSWLHAVHGDAPWIAAAFGGLKAAVVAIVAVALRRIGARALRGSGDLWLAAGAFGALTWLRVPFPAIVLIAGLVGWWTARRMPERVARGRRRDGAVLGDHLAPPAHARPSGRRLLVSIAIGLAVWWLPLLGVRAWRGADDVLWKEAAFFSKAACVTFGGAYAVLAHVNDAAVNVFGWMDSGAMLDGLGLAETTPGPLILVLEFVGFHGGWRHPGGLSPAMAGALGALVTVWATFAPCFLWIFAAAPYMERLRAHRPLAGALAAVTAAVVGVIASLGVSLARSAWWPAGALDPFAVGLSLSAGWALLPGSWNLSWVIGLAAAAGCVRHLLR